MKRLTWTILVLSLMTLALSCQVLCFSRCKSNIELKRAITKERVIALKDNQSYTVSKKVDLKGKTLFFPKGCTVVFKGGVIKNGVIQFDSTKIEGQPSFVNCNYLGNISIDNIDDRCFGSQDETGTFRFLLINAIDNGVRCDFNKNYRISMEDASTLDGLLSFREIDSGADIYFHGNTISNNYPFRSEAIKPVIVFHNVKNVTFHDLYFHDDDEHHCRRHKRSMGCTFIQCYGDCEGVNLLNCSQENGDCILRSGVWVHNETRPEDTPRRGLYNSVLRVCSKNVGYGLVLYCGDSLDLDITVTNPHRGFYCTGVSNSKIRYEGYNPLETKTHILIKDAVYLRTNATGKEVLDMKGCDHLDITAIIPKIQSGERVIGFQSYGTGLKEGADFRFRSDKCHHRDIRVTASIKRAPETGFFHICEFLRDSGAQDESDIKGCKVSGLVLHDIQNSEGTTGRYLCNLEDFAEVDAEIIDCGINEGQKEVVPYLVQVKGNAKGNLTITNSKLGGVLIREKNNGQINVEIDSKSVLNNGMNYINDGTNRSLVRLTRQKGK